MGSLFSFSKWLHSCLEAFMKKLILSPWPTVLPFCSPSVYVLSDLSCVYCSELLFLESLYFTGSSRLFVFFFCCCFVLVFCCSLSITIKYVLHFGT